MQERELKLMSGWPALVGWFLGLGLIVLLIVKWNDIDLLHAFGVKTEVTVRQEAPPKP